MENGRNPITVPAATADLDNGIDFSEEPALQPDDTDEWQDEQINWNDDQLSSSSASARKTKSKRRNQRYKVDMTPPEQLLMRAESSKHSDEDPQIALGHLIRCTALAAIVHGPQSWQYAGSYANLAQGYLDLRGASFAQQAESHAEMSRTILQQARSGTSDSERSGMLHTVVMTYWTLGRAQALLKKNSAAEGSLTKALQVLSELSITSVAVSPSPFVTETSLKLHQTLARLSTRLEKHALAVQHWEKTLDEARAFYGEDSPKLIALYQGLGSAEQAKGRMANHERAIEMYQQAHSIATAQGEPVLSADTARALAAAYSRSGDPVAETSAESYLNEALATQLQLHGPSHPSVCEIQDELARLMLRAGPDRQDEGLRLLRSTLPHKCEAYGDYSEPVMESHQLIGSVQLSRGELDKALAALHPALEMSETLFGANARKTKEIRRTIDSITAHPSMQNRQSGFDMKNRPRFNSVVNRSLTRTGVFN